MCQLTPLSKIRPVWAVRLRRSPPTHGLWCPRRHFRQLPIRAFLRYCPGGTGQIVVAGCEAHVCVLQTVLGLLASGHGVLLVADAIGSRDPADRATAIARARQHGAEVVTSEMVLFEWLRDSQHPKFREMQKLLR